MGIEGLEKITLGELKALLIVDKMSVRYALPVSGNYRVTFGWAKGAIDVDLEDYH